MFPNRIPGPSNASAWFGKHHNRLPEPAAPPVLKTGQELNLGPGQRYRLDKVLTSSACGDIWCATWVQTGEPVTLKALAPQAAPELAKALKHEGEVLRRLSHRYIVRYRYAGTLDGIPIVVMERLHESLRDWLKRHADDQGQTCIDETLALRWIKQTAQALRELHRSGRKHLDLKPSNLLLTAPDALGRQSVKLADFGTSLPLSQELHTFVGTPGWSAPEQTVALAKNADGQPLYATSAASDWYALGQLLHRFLTGQLNSSGQADLARYQAYGFPEWLEHAQGRSQLADDALTWHFQQTHPPESSKHLFTPAAEKENAIKPKQPKEDIYQLANNLLDHLPARRIATANQWFD